MTGAAKLVPWRVFLTVNDGLHVLRALYDGFRRVYGGF